MNLIPTSPWIPLNGQIKPHVIYSALVTCVALIGFFSKDRHSKDGVGLKKQPLPSIPVFPPSHRVLFIDSEIAEEEKEGETEGETGIKTGGQSSAGLLPEERTHFPCLFSSISHTFLLFSLFLSFVKSSSTPL